MDLFAQQRVERVRLSPELIRIARMPRRVWAEEDVAHVVKELTDILKTPRGTMSLRPLQAIALAEIGTVGGLMGILSVGCGKTLVSLLAPVVLEAQRPLLLVPAKLVGKTERDKKILASHWCIPEFFRVMTYEWLGRAQAAAALDSYQPDLIIGDEVHRGKNLKAAVTRRLRRYASANPKTKWVQLSGTVTKRSLHDYAHLLYWALKGNSPLPDKWDDLEMWADALDERKGQMRRADPGALEVLCNDDEKELWATEPRQAARLAYKRRLIETAGVVASYEADVDASLSVQSIEIDVKPATDEAFKILRTWETPDGWPISDGLSLSRHAFELALGFWYRWDPYPPRDWLEARRVWCAYVRKILKHSHKLDSSKQVALVSLEEPEYTEWKKLEDTFKTNTVPVWVDDSALRYCAEWAQEHRGIIWTKHTCFGERLEKDFGITYYGRKGLNSKGELIDNHKPGTPLVASIQSSGEGRNLQAWSTSLITAPPANGLQWEQLLGRLHRPGQEADEVSFDMLTTCVEHVQAFWQAYHDSRYVEQSVGSPQKLLVSDISVPAPEDIALRREARWIKNQY